MMTKRIILIGMLIAGLLLFSCVNNNETKQPENLDADAIRTQAVSTYASSLTETLPASPTAISTLTTITPTASGPIPTATIETPALANPCYNLLWIEDRTIPDGQQLKPNEVFTKTWYVQNNGGCAWAPGFTFNNVGGDLMRGTPVTLSEPVPVGAKREISVKLIVPSGKNGLIQSSWRMADADGNFFGDTLTVNITVGNVTTPAVTNTP
ncbi:MAG: NBR1-Ig-like domain-containing protein [Anaerolineales bacterium]